MGQLALKVTGAPLFYTQGKLSWPINGQTFSKTRRFGQFRGLFSKFQSALPPKLTGVRTNP